MKDSVSIFDPVAPRQDQAPRALQVLSGLAGKTVGFIDNAKPNFNHLADDLSELLVSRYGVASVVRHRKKAASIPASPEIMQELKEQCDVIITGSGD